MIGDRIAYLRNKKEMTQEDLSAELGISRSALSHYEKNRRDPDYETLRKIADIFNVSMDYLLGRSEISEAIFEWDISEFMKHQELSNNNIFNKFVLSIDGRKLTAEEAKRLIAFVQAGKGKK